MVTMATSTASLQFLKPDMCDMISELDLNQKTINDQEAHTVCLYVIYFLCESWGLEGRGEADMILTSRGPKPTSSSTSNLSDLN